MEVPIKQAIYEKGLGLKAISLVADPAIEISWIKMAKESEPLNTKLSIQDKEKRIIFTPVLIPNQLIKRNQGGEIFDLFFSRETIEEIAIQYQRDMLASAVDIQHSQNLIEGVTFFEVVLKDEKRNPTQIGFEDLPFGTLFMTGKVDNDEVWAKIDSGELTGVSIDGLFGTMNVKASAVELSDDKLKELLIQIEI